LFNGRRRGEGEEPGSLEIFYCPSGLGYNIGKNDQRLRRLTLCKLLRMNKIRRGKGIFLFGEGAYLK
jgi:hypothetical protein